MLGGRGPGEQRLFLCTLVSEFLPTPAVVPFAAHRAIEHGLLLGAECLIKCFEGGLRCLQGLGASGCDLAETRLALDHGRMLWLPHELLAQVALLRGSGANCAPPVLPKRPLFGGQLELGLEIGEAPSQPGEALDANATMPVTMFARC